MTRRWPLLILTIISLGVMAAGAWFSGFRLNVTQSMPLGIYRLVDGPVQRGDVVALCPPAPWGALGKNRGYTGDGLCPDGSRQLLKFLVALEGDSIALSPQGITVNGILQKFSIRHTHDRQGRAISSTLESGSVPANLALLLAPVNWSFDSRYFGFVPLHRLQRVQAIFTFNIQEYNDGSPQ